MKLLLHICCAPCGIYVVNQCREAVGQVTGFYFNPNIHPYQEYLNRRRAVEKYANMLNNVMPAKAGIQQQVMDSRLRGNDKMFEVIYPGYDPEEFFRKINYNEAQPDRCRICWKMRLEKAALYARENGFDSFSTTLLISPYQDNAAVKAIGEELAERLDISFYYRDFRTGFRESQLEARRQNLYRQKYCGCIYSETESNKKKEPLENVRI